MVIAEELKKKYEEDLAELKKNCKHEDISDWCDLFEPTHYNDTGWDIISCNICWNILKRKTNCIQCKKEMIYDEEDFQKLKWNVNPDYYIKQGYCSKECFDAMSSYVEIENYE